MSTVQDIVTLQAFDNEASAFRAALADVEQRLQGDPELDEARRNAQELQSAAANLRKEQRRIDGEIAGLTAKVDPEEKRLYDGSVKNPKELSNIQRRVGPAEEAPHDVRRRTPRGYVQHRHDRARGRRGQGHVVDRLEQRWESQIWRSQTRIEEAAGFDPQPTRSATARRK